MLRGHSLLLRLPMPGRACGTVPRRIPPWVRPGGQGSAAPFAALSGCRRRAIGVSGDGPEDAGFTTGKTGKAERVEGIAISTTATNGVLKKQSDRLPAGKLVRIRGKGSPLRAGPENALRFTARAGRFPADRQVQAHGRPAPDPAGGKRPPGAGRALAGGFGPRLAWGQRGAVAGAMAPARIRKARAGGRVPCFSVRQPMRAALFRHCAKT